MGKSKQKMGERGIFGGRKMGTFFWVAKEKGDGGGGGGGGGEKKYCLPPRSPIPNLRREIYLLASPSNFL